MSEREQERRRKRSPSPRYRRYERRDSPPRRRRDYSPDDRRRYSPENYKTKRNYSPERHRRKRNYSPDNRRREYSPKKFKRDYSPEKHRNYEEREHYSSKKYKDEQRRHDSPNEKRDYESSRKEYLPPKETKKEFKKPYSRYYDDDEDEEEEEQFSRDTQEKFGKSIEKSVEYSKDFGAVKPQNTELFQTTIEKTKEIQPISVDELKKEKEQEENSKPVFMTKKERKKQNLSMNDEKNDRKKKIEQMRLEREKMLQARNETKNESYFDQAELEDIKKSFLGENKPQKKQYKPSDRTKFVFDWDESEDTSHDINPIYNQKHEAMLLFGRGKRAGMDEKEHEKNTKFYTDYVQERAKAENITLAPKKKSRFELEENVKHWSQKSQKEMTQRDWRIFCEDHDIATKGGKVPHPIRDWEEGNFPKFIKDAIKKAKYDKPTPVQMQCIPVGLQNRDVIGLSETGSGKTAAFLIPLLVYISKLPKMTSMNCYNGPYALILAPTRELATQILVEAEKLSEFMDIKIVSLIGGVSKQEQSYALKQGAELIIGTPGRILDTIDSRIIVLNQCNYVVLDEFDKMISMNFIDQVNSILESMPSSNLRPENEDEENEKKIYRQTILFSATMSPEVEKLASKYMRNKIVAMIGEIGRAAKNIDQRILFIKQEDKRKKLSEALEENESPILVFVNLKKTADAINKQIENLGFRSTVLTGKKSQDQRNFALEGFKKGKYEVLVATNVVARGIDVEGIKCVINYDMPYLIDDYQHRIGRTARAGKTGIAVSFLTEEDTPIMFDLRQFLMHSNANVPNQLDNHPDALIKPGTIQTKNILK
eukprot:gene5665-9486_t